jgi:acetyl esterase/lipase
MTTAYNPSNKFEIKSWDVEFRKAAKRTLMARVYQPQGAGPFPVLLDLHGGAWNNKDRAEYSSLPSISRALTRRRIRRLCRMPTTACAG